VVEAHADRIESTLAELHRSPKRRLKALMSVLAKRADAIAQYGCRYGTLCSELAKRAENTQLD
jgi:hypothetical protein